MISVGLLALVLAPCVALGSHDVALDSAPSAATSPEQNAPSTSVAPGTLPLATTLVNVDWTRQTVTFAVQNTGTKVVTAWDVSIAVGSEPAAKYGGHGVDAFREYGGLTDGRYYIVPGGSVSAEAKLPAGATTFANVVVAPTAAVFADNTWVGDPKFVELLFVRRAAQRDAWQEIVEQLEAPLEQGSATVEVLDRLLREVTEASNRNGDPVRSMVRANLSLAAASAREGRALPAVALRRLLDDARRNLAVTTVHTRR